MDQQQWVVKLQAFIYATLAPIIPDDNERKKYVDVKSMPIWIKAFTHETYSPSNNYEDLEYLGDAMLKSTFPRYIMKKFPRLHKQNYSEIDNKFRAGVYHQKYSKKLGFEAYIRTKGLGDIEEPMYNLRADVFEAFFGALAVVSDRIVEGLSFINCYNMVDEVFKDETITEDDGKPSDITQFEQIFTRFNLTQASDKAQIKTISTNPTTVSLYLSPSQLELIKSLMKVSLSNPIATASANTKKAAKSALYQAGLVELKKYGITPEWAVDMKHQKDISGIISRWGEALAKAKKLGYTDLRFDAPSKTITRNGGVLILMGMKNDEPIDTVAATYYTGDPTSVRSKLVDDFLQN